MKYEKLTEEIIGSAYEVFNVLNFGHLESVYEKSLLIELESKDINAENQTPLNVTYKGNIVGEFLADILVENKVLLELKSVESLHQKHEVQLVSYLTVTEIDVGLLINFGPTGVEVNRKVRNLSENR